MPRGSDLEQGKQHKDGSRRARAGRLLLTALNRDTWLQRDKLLADPLCAESLRLVESAICCVAFDRASSPRTKEKAGRLCLGVARVATAVRQVVHVGDLREWTVRHQRRAHAGRCHDDGLPLHPVQRLDASQAHSRSQRLPRVAAAAARPPLLPPKLLKWKLGASTRAALEVASAEVVALADDVEIRHLEFLHYGKSFIKRSLHPDFFMQMAIQLAHHRLHGRFVATYETGHTRAFYHGRTDTVRTLSLESVAFCEAMLSSTTTEQDKIGALRAACHAHGEQVQRVLTGQGIDRHLLGLYIAAYLKGGETMPTIFTDPAYKAAGGGGNYRLSTSNTGYTPLFGGFSPMTTDGYSVCYTLENRMNIIISARNSCETRQQVP